MPIQHPTQAAVTGTVDVVGAPANDFQSGVQACTAAPTATTCEGEQEAFSGQNGTYALLLTPETWWVRAFVNVYGSRRANRRPRLSWCTPSLGWSRTRTSTSPCRSRKVPPHPSLRCGIHTGSAVS